MLAEDGAVRTDVEQRVVDRRPATLGIDLVDADGHGNAPRSGRLAELLLALLGTVTAFARSSAYASRNGCV